MTTDQPNQVWAADITDVPLARGFLYRVAFLDWATRKVLACYFVRVNQPSRVA